MFYKINRYKFYNFVNFKIKIEIQNTFYFKIINKSRTAIVIITFYNDNFYLTDKND